MFAPPAAAPSRPFAAPAPAKASAPKPPIAAPPALRPLRQDPPPPEGQAALIFLRAGVDLGDGSQSIVGDQCNLGIDQARALVLRGCADYAPKATANG